MIYKIKLLTATAVLFLLSACGGGGDDGKRTVTSCITIPGVGYTPPGTGVPVSCVSTDVSTTPTTNTPGLCCYSTNYTFAGGTFIAGNPTIRACGAGEKPTLKC